MIAWPEGDDEIVKIIMEHFFDSVFLILFFFLQMGHGFILIVCFLAGGWVENFLKSCPL